MKRNTFITGHYGSGKSEFSVNLALIKKVGFLVDLDIVNPYFRSRELEDIFLENKIQLISSSVKDALGSDLPYIAKEAFLPFYHNLTSIFDLGGDDVGARILRQFSDLLDEKENDLLLCVNVFRENTSNADKVIKMISEIENSGGVKVTGLINNSNLLRETSYLDLLSGEKILREVEKRTGLKIIYTGVYERILKSCGKLEGEVVPLKLYLRKKWL
jgi:RNA-binding protein YhbY